MILTLSNDLVYKYGKMRGKNPSFQNSCWYLFRPFGHFLC